MTLTFLFSLPFENSLKNQQKLFILAANILFIAEHFANINKNDIILKSEVKHENLFC